MALSFGEIVKEIKEEENKKKTKDKIKIPS